MKQMKSLAIQAFLVGVLLVTAIPASAERTLTVQVNHSDRVEIQSETQTGGSEASFRFKAEQPNSSGSWPKLAVEVEKETSGQNGTGVEVEFRAAFREAFEFSDANGNGRQDPQESRVSTVRFDSLNFAPLEVATETANGVAGYKVTIRGTQGGFAFGLVSHTFPSQTELNGSLLPDQAIKVDVVLEGYPFVSGTSLLGLEIGAESTVQREPEFRDASHSAEITVERGTAFFRWTPEARVDGRRAPVGAVWQADGDRLFLYYPHGNSIVHDPMLGFESGPSLMPILVVVGAAGAIVITAGVLTLIRRRRRGGADLSRTPRKGAAGSKKDKTSSDTKLW